MMRAKTTTVGRQLQVLWTAGTLTGLTDAELLTRFTETQDATGESAFAELVERHGPMVMGVCRQILRHPHDADDAFQATFLVLVRKAQAVRVGESLAPWLYRVALRTAHRARANASRQPQASDGLEETPAVRSEASFQVDLRPLIHEELDRLPEKYRVPIVLCHLEGKSHEQAAQLLSWPIGTVSGRLSRGRQLLKSRLERRGLGVPSVILSTSSLNIAQSVPISLVESTVAAAIRFATAQSVSTSVLALTQGVLRAMFFNKLKTVSLALLLVGAVSGGAGVWARWKSTDSGRPEQAEKTVAVPSPGALGASPATAVPFASPSGPFLVNSFNPNSAGYPGQFLMLKSTGIVVVESPDRTAMEAMSFESDLTRWQKLDIPAGVTATPIMSNDTMALLYKGKSIDEVAAFSAYTGEWRTQRLYKPVEVPITPVIGPGSALYRAGNDFYAFSAKTGTWGVLRLESKEEAKSVLSQTDISVFQGNRLYIFGLKLGKWSRGVEMRHVPPSTGSERSKGTPFSPPGPGGAEPVPGLAPR